MDVAAILGYLAGALTTISFIPQLTKAWRTKSTKDISIVMYIAFILGLLLWIIYGFIIDAIPIIVANLITITLAVIILGLKIRYR